MTMRLRPRWVILLVLVAVTVAIGYVVTGPSPPRSIVWATGQSGGAYSTFGTEYATRLGGIGLRTRVVESAGSLDNIQRLIRGEVDVAFAQSGTYAIAGDTAGRLRGIAAIYREPLWIFHRGGPSVKSLSDLAGRRVSIGLPQSGTEAIATIILRDHGIDAAASDVVRLSNAQARAELKRGTLYGAFFVASYRDPIIEDLMGDPDVALFGIRRETAYARRFPGLTTIKIHEGLFDLRRNIPASDTVLLSPAALIVCRADLHPRVVEQILKVAQSIHGPGSLIDPPQRFPSREGVDVPLHEAAEVYLSNGESFVSRTLPYPVLRWTPLFRLLVVSLILWIPVVRFLPEVAKWRVDRRFGRLYGLLRDAERRLEVARDPEAIRAGIRELERLQTEAQAICDGVPGSRQHDAYHWRMHIAFVRSEATTRLLLLESETTSRDRRAD
jgi:TRAP transporter TAXI family solute receptor